MKRIIILAIIGFCISGASMAQGQKLKGRLIDMDHYPVKNAKVTVKGTNLSTTSDKDGNFFIEDVPLYLDSIQVEKGRKDITVNTPMKISMGRLVIDKRFSWFVKAGVGVSRFLGADETKDKVSFHVGGGVDIKMAKHWSFQPAAYIAYREMEGNTWYYSDETTNYKLTYLEIPLLFAYKFRLSSSMNWVIAAGPYVDCGINGDIRDVRKLYNSSPDGYGSQYTYETEESEAFGKRFTGGAAYSMGVEGRHFTFSLTGRTGWTSWRRSEGFTNLEFEIGYKF